ncbi:MAG: alpha/beta hydrolase [Candidatus Marinimicrobia bacterium]|nr:alpha/beta hydrolase [Candidatus Neomarinimicrobiota bacterium]
MIKRRSIQIPILASFVVLWLSLFIYQKHLQNRVKEETTIITPDGINSLEKITLGGIDQWVLIRGWSKSNPVLLFLHGGPGAPLFTYAREIGVKAKLEQHFVMVYWEQRGTGKSFSPNIPEESMTIEQFISDTHELVELLRYRFKAPKIFLVGRSWGSIIGIFTAKRHPELFYAYVGIGQIVNSLENDKISYQFTLETAARLGNEKALKDLEEIGPPPYDYKKLIIQRKWLTEFSKIIMAEKTGKDYPISNSRIKLLSTPEYSLIDILKMGINPYFSIKHLWDDEYYRINLFEQVPQMELPVYFLAGRYDYFTPSEIVEHYYQKLIAPKGKHFIWFENSGHEPEFEETEKFYDIMVNKVLEKTINLDYPLDLYR